MLVIFGIVEWHLIFKPWYMYSNIIKMCCSAIFMQNDWNHSLKCLIDHFLSDVFLEFIRFHSFKFTRLIMNVKMCFSSNFELTQFLCMFYKSVAEINFRSVNFFSVISKWRTIKEVLFMIREKQISKKHIKLWVKLRKIIINQKTLNWTMWFQKIHLKKKYMSQKIVQTFWQREGRKDIYSDE